MIAVQYASDCAGLPSVEQLQGWASATLDAERRSDAEVCLRIVDEAEAQQVNARYRSIDRPTNVLSFTTEVEGLPEGLGEDTLPLGDILLCAPIVTRESREQNKPEDNHWAHLVVHGVLHLLGYDHESEAEARAMEGREIDVLERLGIPNPYKSPHSADPG